MTAEDAEALGLPFRLAEGRVWLRDALAVGQSVPTGSTLLTLDFAPLGGLLPNVRPSPGAPLWWDNDRTWSMTRHPAPAVVFAGADYVMVPRIAIAPPPPEPAAAGKDLWPLPCRPFHRGERHEVLAAASPGDMMSATGLASHRVVRYGVVSVAALALDLVLFYGLTFFRMHYVPAAIAAFMAAVVFNYALSNRHVFTGEARISQPWHFLFFAGVGIAAGFVGLAVMAALTDSLGIPYQASKLISVVVSFIFNYALRRRLYRRG